MCSIDRRRFKSADFITKWLNRPSPNSPIRKADLYLFWLAIYFFLTLARCAVQTGFTCALLTSPHALLSRTIDMHIIGAFLSYRGSLCIGCLLRCECKVFKPMHVYELHIYRYVPLSLSPPSVFLQSITMRSLSLLSDRTRWIIEL